MNSRSVFSTLALGMLFLMVESAAARGVMKVSLQKPLVVAGKSIGPGSCLITWTTHSPETDVSFEMHDKVVIEAHGKMVERPEKAEKDTLVTVKDDSGNQVLKEIRFGGKRSVLVLE